MKSQVRYLLLGLAVLINLIPAVAQSISIYEVQFNNITAELEMTAILHRR